MAEGVAALPRRSVLETWQGATGFLVLAALLIVALAAPAVTSDDPLAIVGRPLLRPLADPRFLLGTDRLGRDILAGLAHGARATLWTALSVAVIGLCVGSLVGAMAGSIGGVLDEILMRIADATQAVPSFVLALALVSVLGPTQPTIVVALAAAAWTAPARIVRAQVLSLRERPFVEASRLLGRHPFAIAWGVILPNALGPLFALAAVLVANAVLAESALSFLGLNDPNVASWGAMIAEGRAVMRTAPHVIAAPGLAVMITVLAVSLLGEGLSRSRAARGT